MGVAGTNLRNVGGTSGNLERAQSGLGQDQKDMDVVYPGASPFSVFLDKGLEHSFLFGGIRHPGYGLFKELIPDLQTDAGITHHVLVLVSSLWKLPSLVVRGEQVELIVVDTVVSGD